VAVMLNIIIVHKKKKALRPSVQAYFIVIVSLVFKSGRPLDLKISG
jgi:hypothetical protein